MQLFMRNFAYGTKELDIELALAPLLHRPPFDTDAPINFHVSMFTSRGQRGKRGPLFGTLTLPSEEVGRLVLAICNNFKVKGRPIGLSPQKRPPDEGLIAQVQSTVWQDPVPIEEERATRAKNSSPIFLDNLVFGRLCRDGVFSVEYEPVSQAAPLVTAECDQERRRMQFRQLSDPELIAWFRASQLYAMVKSGNQIFIETTSPPVFAKKVSLPDDFSAEDREPPAERQSSFSGTHDGMPPGTSRFIRLSFKSKDDLESFTRRVNFMHNQGHYFGDLTSDNRELYHPDKQLLAEVFMRSIDYKLAFELDRAIANGVLDYDELLQLRQSIRDIVASNPDNVDSILGTFIHALEVNPPSLSRLHELKSGLLAVSILNKAKPRKRRRNKNKNKNRSTPQVPERITAPTLSQILDQCAMSYKPQQQRRTRLTFRPSPAVYQSHRFTLTPSSRALDGPLPDQSNSMLRDFGHHDCFLRVTFQGENRAILRGDYPTLSISELLRTRFKRALTHGVTVGGRRFTFLGYSMSALKEHSVVFVNEQGLGRTAKQLRRSFGDFSKIIHYPALLGARWSQHFSASDPSVQLRPDEIEFDVPDIKSVSSVFTDGCSTMSPELRDAAWKELRDQGRASARDIDKPVTFQIRFAGAKGVVTVDPRLQGRGKLLRLRNSQTKFVNQTARILNITSTSARPIRMFLNRPLIMLLEHLGTNIETFKRLQRDAIKDIEQMKSSLLQASKLLNQHGLGLSFRLPSLFNNFARQLKLPNLSVPNLDCKILQDSLDFAVTHVLREIKFRAHLPVPGSYTLLGIADEWDCLEEGEIYATVSDRRSIFHPEGVYEEIGGRVLVTRSPQIHTGDVQFVTAVRRPELAHLKNVVVFSCRGERSLPSCLGGGDLDGDIYNLILDPDLFPTRTTNPGSYTPLDRKRTVNPCTVVDVMDFVIDYLQTDLVGAISILHLRIADLDGAGCADCIKLAEKASHAVDFPKTGTPVNFIDLPRPKSSLRPDFLAQEIVEPTEQTPFYPSKNILGHLFRAVPLKLETLHEEWQSFGEEIPRALRSLNQLGARLGLPSLYDSSDELLDEMHEVMRAYISELNKIAYAHTMSRRAGERLREAEIVIGSIQASWADHRKRKEAVVAMNLQTQELVKAIRDEFKREDHEIDTGQGSEQTSTVEFDDDDDDGFEEVLSEKDLIAFKRAAAAWTVAQDALKEDDMMFGPSSFGLLALGEILAVVKKAKEAYD